MGGARRVLNDRWARRQPRRAGIDEPEYPSKWNQIPTRDERADLLECVAKPHQRAPVDESAMCNGNFVRGGQENSAAPRRKRHVGFHRQMNSRTARRHFRHIRRNFATALSPARGKKCPNTGHFLPGARIFTPVLSDISLARHIRPVAVLPRLPLWVVAVLLASVLPCDIAVAQGGSGAGAPYSHSSSIDGQPLEGLVFVPSGYSQSSPPTALVVYLHGGGGLGIVPVGWPQLLNTRGWILVAPHGREWGLSDPALCPTNPNAAGTCSWCTSAAYVDNPFDPLVGPGEQDILDSVDWAMDTFNINPDRVYLTGFSMGGRGTYQIGLRNPDRFAAIAPCAPASDMFEIFVADPNPPDLCKRFMLHDGAGGLVPHASGATDSMYFQTSARFLIENAMNLPVHHSHGTLDSLAYNIITAPTRYRHGACMLYDNSFSGCHGASDLCFGHTPTLSDLATANPGLYSWTYKFTNIGHTLDQQWAAQIFAHFDAAVRPAHPRTVFYKTYTDTAVRSHWLRVQSAVPWTGQPAAVRAAAAPAQNMLELSVCRTNEVRIDLPWAELSLSPKSPLTVVVRRLDASGLDPALASTAESLATTISLVGASPCGPLAATINGAPAPAGFVRWVGDRVAFGPLVAPAGDPVALHAVVVSELACDPPCPADWSGNGAVDGPDLATLLSAWGVQGDAGTVLGDLTVDGRVDGADLSTLLAVWGPCNAP